jgi:hypothetical protein
MKRETAEATIELLEVLEAPSEFRQRDLWRIQRRFGSWIVQQCIQELQAEVDRHDLSSDSGVEVDQCK